MSDQEWKRLQDLYASMHDAELSKLYEQRGDLTETAQRALTNEFQARKLELPTSEGEVDPSEAPEDGSLVELSEFTDAIDANDALAVLEREELHGSLRPARTVERTDGSEVVIWQLLVDRAQKEQAIKLLREHKGLFPLAEINLHQTYLPDEDDLFVIGEFDHLEDAAIVEVALSAAKVAFRRRDEPHEGKTIAVFEVAQNDVDRAGAAMESAFAAGDEAF